MEIMIKTERSHETSASIINLSSVAGLKASPGLSAYAMTKGGVRLLSKSVAKECINAGYAIRVNSVHPGIIETAMIKDTFDTETIKQMVPMKRAGKVDEVADLVSFIASPRAAYITGQIISINGGII
ncbi:MAG: hypothetical protein COB34_06660 [Methylophilaceae bacterium]|nr:MAG: hypothetical protein COB34_06660 [Methylophilaceae bacterium]